MQDLRPITCCFTGYRAEKMPFPAEDTAALSLLTQRLDEAIADAAAQGILRFFTGMSTGFDLWAAQAVLRAREKHGLKLLCAIPFDAQADHFSADWKAIFNHVLLHADQVFILSRGYHTGCYAERNRFMVDASSRLICYFDGRPGGTAQTVRMAQASNLTVINLAENQLTLL